MEHKRKRKVDFNPNVQTVSTNQQQKKRANETENTRLHTGKYSLDSDEEDQEEQTNLQQMNQDDLEEIGQEKATIGFDEDVKITPFNIDEELEDGHYDQTGSFIWKQKDKDEVHDAWLDEIDWTNVKNYKLTNPQSTFDHLEDQTKNNLSNDDEIDSDQFNELNILKLMLTIMQPNETVLRTIKRLGPPTLKNLKSKQRKLLPGETSLPTPTEQSQEELKKNKVLLEQMSGLANQFVSNGQLDIYEQTFERLKFKLDRLHSSNTSNTTDSNFHIDDRIQQSNNNSTSTKLTNSSSAILWEYTNDERSKEQLQGPFTTEQMIRLTNTEGKLDKDKVRCRRIDTEQFYSIKRIDFDLFLD